MIFAHGLIRMKSWYDTMIVTAISLRTGSLFSSKEKLTMLAFHPY